MAAVKWIKIVTDIFDDEKVRFIESMPNGDGILVIWFKLLCLAGKSNSFGYLMFTSRLPYTDEMLASIFNRDIKEIKYAIELFQQLEMVEVEDNKISITNWDKHQNIEGMEKIREQTRKRVQEHRERKKALECNVTCNATVTQSNATDKEEEKEIEEDKEIKKVSKKKTSFDEILDELHNDELKDALLEFIKFRKLIKSPLTDRALRLNINTLFKLSNDSAEMVEIINQSIENGWKSFYALKKNNNKNSYFNDDLAF